MLWRFTDANLRAACARLIGVPDWREVEPEALGKLQQDLRKLPEPQLYVIVMHYVSDVEPAMKRAQAMGLSEEWYQLLYLSGLKLLTEIRARRDRLDGGDPEAGPSLRSVH